MIKNSVDENVVDTGLSRK